MDYKGQIGTSITILSNKIKDELNEQKKKIEKKIEKKTKRKINGKSHKSGNIKLEDLTRIQSGLIAIRKITDKVISDQEQKILLGKGNISKNRSDIVRYKYVIDDLLSRAINGIELECSLKKEIEDLQKNPTIAQAARDGIIIKQEHKKEIVDGKEQFVTYDTPMTQREVMGIINEFELMRERRRKNNINNYIDLGFSVIGLIGCLINQRQEEISIISFGTLAVAGAKTINEMLNQKEKSKQWPLNSQKHGLINDLMDNEATNNQDINDQVKTIEKQATEIKQTDEKILNNSAFFNSTIDVIVAQLVGSYIINQVVVNDKGEFDGKLLADTLLSLQPTKELGKEIVSTVLRIKSSLNSEPYYKDMKMAVDDIISQMEEKVYPLKGAEKEFNSISIKDLHGHFYPKKNYLTNEINFDLVLDVDEFSIKRGETVLLTGDSGSGKSTFLRLLKRGDINNRDCITLDNGQKVDNLGNQYISYRPMITLGDETNALMQITRKLNPSGLNKKETEKLLKIMGQLKFYNQEESDGHEVIEQLKSKKFMEFSTGQQKRLVLAKLLYRINNKISIIIVDEPIGNVEEDLMREQLGIIKKYAENHNLMLLLVTHRIDLAQEVATKRYHIQDGKLEEKELPKEKEVQEI